MLGKSCSVLGRNSVDTVLNLIVGYYSGVLAATTSDEKVT